ncbi:Ovarian tumor otubain [Penicillium macrosclerotiorum]|uniref:Ovarian tumor otubain n=1 Tax=Penicillium macrosclerotiorum TaxID=303699 RepID=UPI002549B6A8|nr:Ovarian tumor otubain [Penicillium macrosclerotiorum]KAJ5692386.1 Ovarian tumor otubain [Penicillium macrosclerotiorum]
MSLSKLPWSHFGPHHPFLEKQKFVGFYRDAPAPAALLPPPGLAIPAAFDLPGTRNMSNLNLNTLSPDEMERFQKLSNEFQPEVQGPLVSPKQSSHTIALEYANADPTLATKTSALALTHPMTRVMKGDGNCGWRAVAFGYFETLFALRDPLRTQRELARIKSLNSLLDQVGHQEHLYEIFVDATEEVFAQTLAAIQNGDQDESFLVNAFNDEYNSDAVITHFRLLTSAWMKLNPQRYQAFLSLPLIKYCETRVETVRTEIDEVGLQALVDGVIDAAGFGVEILYLDRSEGEAVTPHQLSPNRPSGATIRLLYRPGHYDLLYRAEATVNMAPVVNYQYAMTSNYSPWDQSALPFDVNSHLMSIPNLMADPAFPLGGAPMSPIPSVSPSPGSPYRISPTQEMYQSPMQAHAPIPSISAPSPTPVMPPVAPPSMTTLSGRSSSGPQIRLNPLVMKPNLSHSLPVTTPFKNSPYNQAHFQNQDFEPIHWEPSDSRR